MVLKSLKIKILTHVEGHFRTFRAGIFGIWALPDNTTPVRDNCGQSELPWKSKTDEISKNTQSMYKRSLPLESECS